MIDQDDIDQEYELQRLLGKTNNKWHVLIEMLRSGKYGPSLRSHSVEYYIVDNPGTHFEDLLSYQVDYDLTLDYELELSYIKGWYREALRMWSEGYSLVEIARRYNKSDAHISRVISTSIERIRNKWGIKV